MPLACIWKAPFTSVTVLDMAPVSPDLGLSFANAISDDGNTVVGWVADFFGPFGSRHRAARWTNIALTQVASDLRTEAMYCTANGNLAVLNTQLTNLRTWPSIGVDHTLPLPGGYTNSYFPTVTGARTDGLAFRSCSDNGNTVIGNIQPGDDGCRWDGEVPTALSPPAGYDTCGVLCCSSDGSRVFGSLGKNTVIGSFGCYWTGTTCHVMTDPASTQPNYGGSMSASDGSVVWGLAWSDANGMVFPTYWDGIGTGGGTPHYMQRLSPTFSDACVVSYVADNPSALTAVGNNQLASGEAVAVRWVGTTISALGKLPGSYTYATGCSPDGTIVTGWFVDFDGNTIPCYWDVGGGIHSLPSLANFDDNFKGKAYGISRDGSTIFGIIDVGDIVVPVTTSMAELWFGQTAGYVDLTSASNRRKFYAEEGGAPDLGVSGQIPFGSTPPVFLTRISDPSTFTVNNGRGGSFPPSEGGLTESNTNPPGSMKILVAPGKMGRGVLGDYRNGNLYAFNPATYLDNGTQRKWVRRWRALPHGTIAATRYGYLTIEMQTGAGVPQGSNPQIMLRWSDDGGHTWTKHRIKAAGRPGDTVTTVKFDRLGSTRRFAGADRIFELSSTDPFQVAILDAEIDS